ncbi:tripartite tricarboxylate transporter substrate binding protein [Curvibacter sp. HBC28]|uniref:Tripartite tricarboxylate transporter substrate binding protein n=2 Tax=Curvibacter microcysteis TaxID=3026419 RepID=A0ABT5MBW4_9BURK|nr:tripartite tricarboxylate transporter substrate binding protein [Curvibacter sp. HBC28]
MALTEGQAQTPKYPDRPLRVLHGFGAGGNADTVARILAAEMGKGLGQSVVVEPKPGAGGTIAAGTVASAKADGYTLLLATGGHAIAGALYDRLPYDTAKSFQAISAVTSFPFLIVAQAGGKYSSLQDLLKAAKARSQDLTFGSAGVGTGQHMAGAWLAQQAGVNLTHVPYRGESASMTGLLSGEVDMVVVAPTTAVQHIKAGKLQALATTGANRWTGMPELRTVAEQGVAQFEVRSWTALLAPAGLPKLQLDRLQAEVRRALSEDSVRARLEEATGGEVKANTPAELHATIQSDLKRWTQLVKDANIQKE